MKFREYGNVKPLTIDGVSANVLSQKIEDIGQRSDIIDLQFSTSYDENLGHIVYSALLLVKEK